MISCVQLIQHNFFVVVVLFSGSFASKTVATAMNATGNVDTTPACTRAYAHYSRAHFTRDDCTCGSRLISVAHFSETLSSLCHVLVWCACHGSLSRHSASSTPLARTRSNPCTSTHWSGMSGCLANPTSHTASRRNEVGESDCRFSESGWRGVQ